MTGGTESQSESTEGRPTSRVGTALWGSLVWGSTAWGDLRRRVEGGERGPATMW